MKILVFDNYDSFTYNLVHLLEKIIHDKVTVARNDEIALEEVDKYDKIILCTGWKFDNDIFSFDVPLCIKNKIYFLFLLLTKIIN